MIAKFKDIKTLDEFAKLDLKWLVDGFIKEQTITQLFGQSGGGKTTLSLALAKYALDNKSIKQVIYIDCDNSLASLNDNNVRDFIEKYKNIFYYYPDYEPSRFECDFSSCDDFTGVLLIIDGTINLIDGGKINSDESAIKFMRFIKELRAKRLTIIFQNHTAKHDKSSSKGNNQLENYSDENFKTERMASTYTLTPKKYRIPNISPLKIEVDKTSFEIKSICRFSELFNLSDEEKMSIKLCVEILEQDESGLNQKELTTKLYKIKDETHFEIVGRNKLWSLLKKFENKLFSIKTGEKPNEKIYKLCQNKNADEIKKIVLDMEDL